MSFQRMGMTENRMFGPRVLLVCGFRPEEQDGVAALVDRRGYAELPLVFAGSDHSAMTVGDTAGLPDGTGRGTPASLARAVIFGGVTEVELHTIMGDYRESGLPRPLWATITPVSVDWTLADLLMELGDERTAMG